MSNFSVTGDTPAHKCKAEASNVTISASATPRMNMQSWYIEMLMIVVGLLALAFYIALGGMFALLGPWVIYMGVLSIRKRSSSTGRALRIITGTSLFCLSVAILIVPVHTGLWCIVGGMLGLLAGLGYLAVTLFYHRLRKLR